MDCSAAALARAACRWCLPDDRQRAAQLFLLCRWASGTSPYPCGAPSNTIQISGAGTVGVNQTYTLTGPNFYTSADAQWFLYYDGVVGSDWLIEDFFAVVYYQTEPSLFPCSWTTVEDSGTAPAPTGKYI
jgi:hypothetical protein